MTQVSEEDRSRRNRSDTGSRAVRSPESGTRLSRRLAWPALLVLTAALCALIPALFVHRYYFFGDTQAGAVGQWYALGRDVRAGHLPILDLSTWRAGNILAEGQWGIYSPLTVLVAVVTSVVPNFVVWVSVLKTGLLVGGALGMYLLARSHGVRPALAYLAGVAITIGGATQYLESPSWVTGQMAWALLPWLWWSLIRLRRRGANPAPALIFGYLIVTIGYVYGTMFLIIVLLAVLLDALLARDRGGFLKVFGVGVVSGLVALTVYLPGVLTASVTTRSGTGILSDGRLQTDLAGLVTSMVPTNLSAGSPDLPTEYLVWFLPVLFWLSPARAKAALRPLAGAILFLVVMLAWTLGPNQIGPIRWPMRVLPEVTIGVVLVLVVLISRSMVPRPSGRRLVLSLAAVLAACYLVVARFWTFRSQAAVSFVVVAAALVVLWLAVRRWGVGVVAGVVGGMACVGVTTLQHAYYPSPPSVDRNMSAVPSDYPHTVRAAHGDTMLLGDPEQLIIKRPAATRSLLLGSSWYLTDKPVQSVYSTIGFATYDHRYCFVYNGATCPGALRTLFSKEPTTGARRVDLLSVNTLVLNRQQFTRAQVTRPPDGWHIAQANRVKVTWVRDRAVAPAGGVVWQSPGLHAQVEATSTRGVRLKVRSVPAGGGTLVFSRLDWPGYSVSGGSLAKSTDGYLVTVHVPATAAGHDVVVHFTPPGWHLELASLVVAVGGGIAWSIAGFVLSRRRKRATTVGPSSRPVSTQLPGGDIL